MTLMQAVAGAGGPTTVANIESVKILRPESNGTRKTLEYSISDIRNGLATDPEIRGEDVVQVDANLAKSSIKQVFEYILPFVVIGSFL
jgi:polysaccharide export outer membrane protein